MRLCGHGATWLLALVHRFKNEVLSCVQLRSRVATDSRCVLEWQGILQLSRLGVRLVFEQAESSDQCCGKNNFVREVEREN